MTESGTAVLLIDAGNTRVKFAYYETLLAADAAARLEQMAPSKQTQQSAQPEPIKFILTHANIEGLAPQLREFAKKPRLVVGVNVSGPLTAARIKEQLDAHCGEQAYELHWLSSEPQLLHLSNAYSDHQQLGSDRWLAMLGLSVHEKAQERPAMLVSFGTATTIDTVFRDQFLGGLILPGLQLMTDSLVSGTAQLPAIQWEKSSLPAEFPSSTAEALESGMIAAQVGAVLRQWSYVVKRCQQPPVVFYAGGAAAYVVPELSRLLSEQACLHGFDTIELLPFEDPALAGLLLYAQYYLAQ